MVKTISDGLEQRRDNFLLLRFIAAALVIYGHAPAITGGAAQQDLFARLGWGRVFRSIAVDLFFVISGFLVTGSYFRRPHLISFAWARLLRIVPAYLVLLLLCAFALGPWFSSLRTADYFAQDGTYLYVTSNLKFSASHLIWKLPGVFTANPRSPTVNGAIWTLPAEVRMYAWVALLGVAGLVHRRGLFNVAFALLMLYGALHPDDIFLVDLPAYVRMAGLFAAGAFCYINRDYLPVSAIALFVVIGAACLFRDLPVYPWLFGAAEVLFVFWFAYGLPDLGFERVGDYSYGIYLWGYPSQQMLAATWPTLSALANFIAGFAVALGIAAISWHIVEKPALRLKRVPEWLWIRFSLGARWQALRARVRR